MVAGEIVRDGEGDRLAILALSDPGLILQRVGPVTVFSRGQGDTSLECDIVTILCDRNFSPRCVLGLDITPESIGAIWCFAVRVAELVVAALDGFTHHTLAQANGVLRVIHDHVSGGLADAILVKSGFELDEAILDATVAAQSLGDVFRNGAGESTVGGNALTDGFFGSVQGGGLQVNAVESVWDLETLAKRDRELGTLLDLVTRVVDTDVKRSVDGVLVSVTTVDLGLGDRDATGCR